MAICTNCGFGEGGVGLQAEASLGPNHPSVMVDPFARLAELDAKFDRLLDERISLKKAINALFSPILRLPSEVLSEICLHSLPEADGAGFQPQPSLGTAPLLLGRICTQWRAVAYSTPELWSSISLTLSQDDLDYPWLIEVWLARSGHSPLTIRLHCYLEYNFDHLRTILEPLLMYSHQWRAVDLLLPVDFFPFLVDVKGRLSSLRYLSFEPSSVDNEAYTSMSTALSLDVFSVAPQLREVRLLFSVRPFVLILPWGQLTRLWMHHLPVDECLEILRQSPNIVDCTVQPLAVRNVPYPSVRHVQLSALVVWESDDCGTKLWSCLSLPALHVVEIGTPWGSWQPRLGFFPFLTRSSCLLEKLSIHGNSINDDDLIECLRLAPTLIFLEVGCSNGNRITDKILRELTHPIAGMSQSACLAPKLQDIKFSGLISFTGHALATMLSSRWRMDGTAEFESVGGKVVRLQSFQLQTNDLEEDEEVISRLRTMANEGMQIRIEIGESCWLG